MRDLLAGVATLRSGELRVAADSPTHVMPLLARLKQRHAGLTFSLRIGNSSDVIRRVLEFECDVGVMAKRVSDPRLHASPLRDDRLVVFVPHRHPWARRRTLLMAELTGCDLVLRERGSITREVFEARLAESGARPGTAARGADARGGARGGAGGLRPRHRVRRASWARISRPMRSKYATPTSR